MTNKKHPAPVGASLIVLSSFFYASYGIWTKLMGDFFQGYTASALRSVLVLLMLLPLAVWYHHLQSLQLKQNWRYVTGMIIASLFTWGPLYYAILHAGVGLSLAVSYASIVIGSFLFGWHAPWLYLICFAIASVIASWSLVKGVKLIDAGVAGILGLLEIVFGVLFGVILFQERPTTSALLGMVIIIGAAAIPYLQDYNAKRGSAA